MNDFDVAIVGGGFGGALTARVARALGKKVVLLERLQHPRFAIGESSTPLTNLLWEELCARYGLEDLAPFSKYGSWVQAFPKVACGLKRGFSFLFHERGRCWRAEDIDDFDLRVAASPNDAVADTHWYRPDFDRALADSARRAGAEYDEGVDVEAVEWRSTGVTLQGRKGGQRTRWTADEVVDAGGGGKGFAALAGVNVVEMPGSPALETVYAHFEGVERWGNLHPEGGIGPYPVDDAALHHVFEDGWMWVLRFNNGLTSAGFTQPATHATHTRNGVETRAKWDRWLTERPSVADQFRSAQATTPYFYQPRVSFRRERAAGDRWRLLPSAAGFVDPLLSTGFVLTLLGIERIGRDWEQGVFRESERGGLYEREVFADLESVAELVFAMYRAAGLGGDRRAVFGRYRALAKVYFAMVSYAETARRLGREYLGAGMLRKNDAAFRLGLREWLGRMASVGEKEFWEGLLNLIRPVDIAGLSRERRPDWYGVELSDLYSGAEKLGATRAELDQMLIRCGLAVGV